MWIFNKCKIFVIYKRATTFNSAMGYDQALKWNHKCFDVQSPTLPLNPTTKCNSYKCERKVTEQLKNQFFKFVLNFKIKVKINFCLLFLKYDFFHGESINQYLFIQCLSHRQDRIQSQILSGVQLVWIQIFLSLRLVAIPRLKKHCLLYYLLIADGRKDRFLPFQRALAKNEISTSSSRN